MAETSFKKRRPGALTIPAAGNPDNESLSMSTAQIEEMMANINCNYPPPMSAPGGPQYQNHMLTQQRNFVEAKRELAAAEAHQVARPPTGPSNMPYPFMTPRERTTNKFDEWHFTSLSSSPDKQPATYLDVAMSEITTPTDSPRPGSESYRERCAEKRRLRTLYRAHKLNRPSARGSSTTLEALSAMLTEADGQTTPSGEQTAKSRQALKNRENAAKARQTTKENLKRLRDQNSVLMTEMKDLQEQNEDLRRKLEQMTMMVRQMQNLEYGSELSQVSR